MNDCNSLRASFPHPCVPTFKNTCNSWGEKHTKYLENVILLNKAALFHRVYVVLSGMQMLQNSRRRCIFLEQPASISVDLLQAMFEVVMFTIPEDEVVEKEKSLSLWNRIENHCVAIPDKDKRDAQTARNLSTKDVLLEDLEQHSGWVWNA